MQYSCRFFVVSCLSCLLLVLNITRDLVFRDRASGCWRFCPTSGIKSRGYCGHRCSSARSKCRVGFVVRAKKTVSYFESVLKLQVTSTG